jgi:hypothetical protein
MRSPQLAIFVLLAALPACALAQYGIDWYAVDGGSGVPKSSTLRLGGTVGQPAPGYSSGGGYRLAAGFWTVATGAAVSGNGLPHPGMSSAPAGTPLGGLGLGALQAAQIRRPLAASGGAGHRPALVSGGQGGGGLLIATRGHYGCAQPGGCGDNGICIVTVVPAPENLLLN